MWYDVCMTSLKVHFDGRVIVPDEPLNLPPGRALQIEIREVDEPPPAKIVFDKKTGLAYFESPPGTPPITLEDVRRAMDDE
jgi:hypothetical protein